MAKTLPCITGGLSVGYEQKSRSSEKRPPRANPVFGRRWLKYILMLADVPGHVLGIARSLAMQRCHLLEVWLCRKKQVDYRVWL